MQPWTREGPAIVLGAHHLVAERMAKSRSLAALGMTSILLFADDGIAP
jgi:hypothetical protein